MHHLICSTLLLCLLPAWSVWSFISSTAFASAATEQMLTSTSLHYALAPNAIDDKEKGKKKSAKKSKPSSSKTESKKESSTNADAAKENDDAKTVVPDSKTKTAEAPAKDNTGFGWTAIIISIIVSLGAGAGIVFIFLRRRAQGPSAPKALLPSTEAEAIVVESKVFQSAADQPTDISSEAFTSHAGMSSVAEPHIKHEREATIPPKSPPVPERASEPISADHRGSEGTSTPDHPTLSQSPSALEKDLTHAPTAAPEKTVFHEKAQAFEKVIPEEKRATSEKKLTETNVPDSAGSIGMLLDDNNIENATGEASRTDLFMLNELEPKPKTEQSEDFVADQLLLPDDAELLIESDLASKDATAQEISLLSRYQHLSTPEEERDFMNQVIICTISNFEDVFEDKSTKPIFVENQAGGFLISKQVSREGCAEVFIVRDFPIEDFFMQESLTPVFELQRSSTVSSGFVIKSPAIVRCSEQSWQLVTKGEILLSAETD
ncbi:MAG: hypothetical protein ACK42Y_03160 [Candidatus Thermochlorobacter sp.]